ncbi:thermonuclease family protein [Turicibacter bilis]|uniref:thermonuclease family protein n=1 Tax=Turicibacter bilis TaxID=2735723 RepID=UPI001BB0CB07|nr:thermonuclease family protein [Turicibacter bilis]MBS3198958.1 thermonuclease family protein [Turicibacter bilis]
MYLEYDEERLDQYGRTLAYVWLDSNVDPTNLNDIQTKMYNAKLIVDGFAVTKQILPNIKYASIFESLDDN